MTVHIRTQEEIAARVKALEAIMIEKDVSVAHADGWNPR